MARRVDEEEEDAENDNKPGTYFDAADVTNTRFLGSPPSTRHRKTLTTRYFVIGFLIFGVLVLIGSLTFTILSHYRAASDPDAEWKMVRRSDWNAQPQRRIVLLRTPAQYVVISHTATKDCVQLAECVAITRNIQRLHLELGFSDIRYNFLVGGDGSVYEGRGWGVKSAHSHINRSPSMSISLIGDFTWLLPSTVDSDAIHQLISTQLTPSPGQLDAARRIIRVGIKHGFITNNYTLLADSDEQISASLAGTHGNKLFQEISTWPHWSPGS